MISSNCQILSDSVRLTTRQKHAIPLMLKSRSVEEGLQDGRHHPPDMVHLDEG